MSRGILDASALLAFLNQEDGSEQVADIIEGDAIICTVNQAEVITKLDEGKMPEAEIREVLRLLKLTIVDFDSELAYKTGLLRSVTKVKGLSLEDRACLALRPKLPVFTTDRNWEGLPLHIDIRLLR